MIRPNDTIIGPSRGTPEGWFPFIDRSIIADKAEVKQWIRDSYAVNAPDDMPDAAIVVAQAFVETGNFTNRWWTERKNAGSLGVTGDAEQNEASPIFTTTMASARAMSAHDLLYATGYINRGGLTPNDDPRYDAYRDAYGFSAYPILADLSGRYAADTNYAITIAERAQQIYRDLPDQEFTLPHEGGQPVSDLVFGRVPHPEYFNHPIRKPEGFGQNDLGQRSVKGVVWHRMLGSLWGTDQYFALPSTGALTDYGVGVLAQDSAASDGQIIRWNDPLGRQSGWASGSYSSFAYGDGAAFVDEYGIDAINRDQASIEISGFQTTPLSPEAKQSIADLTAYWADQSRIPWDVFPIIPGKGYSFVRWHEEFGPEFGQKKCPFDVVKAATPELIELTRGVLKRYQLKETPVEPPVPPTPPTPEPSIFPDGMSEPLAKRLYGSVRVSWAKQPFTFDLDRKECRAWLARGAASIPAGGDYTDGSWPPLTQVIRRGDGSRVYQYSDGTSYQR